MNYQNIPEEMRSRRRWVCYQLEAPKKVGGKPQKVPYQLNGQHASSTDPGTWTTFEKVVAAVGRRKFAGISYCMHADDGLAVIDLDEARNPETGEVTQWAQPIIERLNSYTEISPSGTGYHIFVHGKVPRALKTKTVEVYATSKIMATTGNAIYPYLEIKSSVVAWLYQIYTTTTPTERKQYTGTTGKSASEDDYRLIGWLHQLYRTEDPVVLEAKFKLRYPDRYQQRTREKGMRGTQSYIRYSIEAFLRTLAQRRSKRCS